MKAPRIAATVLLLLTLSAHLHAACSNALLHGTYAFSGQGFIPITSDISPALLRGGFELQRDSRNESEYGWGAPL
jgi:hypothetical protein